MATYVIGDIHGCYDELQALLDKIKFDPTKDILWFTGDLVNGGPHPAEVIRFIKSLGKQHICVLGNHDLVLLAVAAGKITPLNDRVIGFEPILIAPDCDELCNWLRQQPLVHFDPKFNVLLVHAGVLPQWSLQQIQNYANEVQDVLQGSNVTEFYSQMYGNLPDVWDESLTGWARIRFLINCFTRMRFCTPDGKLDLEEKGDISKAPTGYLPWFEITSVRDTKTKILFGHWAALMGNTGVDSAIALDTGCVWGHKLTALRLDDWQYFNVTRINS